MRAEIKEIKHHKENAKFQIQIKNTFGIVFVKLILKSLRGLGKSQISMNQ